MAVDQMIKRVQDALKPSKMRSKLPKSLEVVDIHVEDYVDSDGQDALRMTVVIGEDVDEENIDGDDVTAVRRAIHDRVRDLGIELWPYVRFAKPSDLAAVDDEE